MSRLYLTADTKYEIDCAFGIQHAYSMSGFYGFYEREKKKHINAIECAQIPQLSHSNTESFVHFIFAPKTHLNNSRGKKPMQLMK